MSERRLVIPNRNPEVSVIDRITNYDVAATDALSALQKQIEVYRVLASSAKFTAEEAQILSTLVKTLNALSAEDRARRKDKDAEEALKNLSDEDLLKMLKAKNST